MTYWNRVRSWLRGTLRRSRLEREMDAELRFHVEAYTEDLIRSGVPRTEAVRRARMEFGGIERTKEECRDARGGWFLDNLGQDLRFGLRILTKAPGFTAVAVLTLALGIGSTTAIFSLIDVILLRPLPVRDSEHVFLLKWGAHNGPSFQGYSSFGYCHIDEDGGEREGCSFSYPFFEQLRSQAGVFSSVTAFAGSPGLHLDRGGNRTRVNSPLVSGESFQTLGVRVALGRTLQPSDDVPSAAPVTVLSYGYWQSESGADRSIVGKTLYLDRIPVTIVGVAEPNFSDLIPGQTWDMWLPLALYSRVKPHWSASGLDDNTSAWLTIVGRLKPGVFLAQAQAAVSLFFRNEMLHGAKPLSKEADNPRISLLPVQQGIVGNRWMYQKPFYILMIAVGIVLLIACSNVGGLMLARTASRQKEIAVRPALCVSF